MLEVIAVMASLTLALALVWIALTMLMQMLFYVPFVPTPRAVVDAMIGLACFAPNDTVIELGAGDARLMIAAADYVPPERITGYEIARPVWILGILRLRLARVRAVLLCRDFRGADVSHASVLFCYLAPRSMTYIAKNVVPALAPGTRIVSHGFPLPEHTAVKTEIVRTGRRKARVFLYVV